MITFSVYTSSLRLHGIKFARNIFKGFTWDPTDVFIFQAPPSEFIEGYCTFTNRQNLCTRKCGFVGL